MSKRENDNVDYAIRELLKSGKIVLVLGGCGANVTAVPPTPNILAKGRIPARVIIETSGVPEQSLCTDNPSLRDVCVEYLKWAVHMGLKTTLGQYMTPSADKQSEYGAFIKIIDLAISPGSGGEATTALLSMRWQFQLLALGGDVIVQTAETTTSPQAMITMRDADLAVKALLNAIMERIAQLINDSSLFEPPSLPPEPSPPPPPEPPPPPPPEPPPSPSSATSAPTETSPESETVNGGNSG